MILYFLIVLIMMIMLFHLYASFPLRTHLFKENCIEKSKFKSTSLRFISDSKNDIMKQTYDEIKSPSIVIIAGFEAFNSQLYLQAARNLMKEIPSVGIAVYTDIDIAEKSNELERALESAKVVLCSLVFDFAQVTWLQARLDKVQTRFIFESSLELMSLTYVNGFKLNNSGVKSGPPAPIKAILKQFGAKREEDRMSGYLNLLKIGPSLLKYIPGENVKGIKTWITVYSYWNAGGITNIESMLSFMIQELNLSISTQQLESKLKTLSKDVVETPSTGLYHPNLPNGEYILSPKTYLEWFKSARSSWVVPSSPRVGILLYKKHVISQQAYIGNMIKLLEMEGIIPIPIFINGVEAHTVVRDLFTSKHERASRHSMWDLSPEAVEVDAIINTIGFPLVGGPAGSMEGGRQIEVSKEILSIKNIPYLVAAPLIIQDIESWVSKGVQGLQTVVLYSLPELDGAIETLVLGGLVNGEVISILPERVRKLSRRLKAWIGLRSKSNEEKAISILIYGFPPNVGSVATAALLNVGNSLKNVLIRMREEGYNVGSNEFFLSLESGDQLVEAMRTLSKETILTGSTLSLLKEIKKRSKLDDVQVAIRDVLASELRSWIGKSMTVKMEKQWGSLESYVGIGSVGNGLLRVAGLQLGNCFIGIQPLLGIEGDPMRMLFERDLTPHPQYAAFYQWLQNEIRPDCLIHFGMHGTYEWLPGSTLGSTPDSWPEIMIGDIPNVYIYAANNPSESLLAKRRGFATIVSHNVPPYARSGSYKELASLKALIAEYRSELSTSSNDEGRSVATSKYAALIPIIVSSIEKSGLYDDVPYSIAGETTSYHALTVEQAISYLSSNDPVAVNTFVASFNSYLNTLYNYLLELENRLFSEGLHVFGLRPSENELSGYLDAFVSGKSITNSTIQIISRGVTKGITKNDLLFELCQYDTKRMRAQNTFLSETWKTSNSSGVHWRDLFTDEDYLGWSLLFDSSIRGGDVLLSERIQSWLQFQYLKFRRVWGFTGAEQEIDDLIRIQLCKRLNKEYEAGSKKESNPINNAVDLAYLLYENADHELNSLMNVLSGGFVPAAPGGDVIRDGVSVLPTGRNIYSLDPYRIPSQLAMARGKEAVRQIIQGYQNKAKGGIVSYPETVAVTLWGLDTIKTKGESIAIVLALVGAEPVREATGRIVDFSLVPLSELQRPRIDVLCSLSGIFRDSFGNILDLLDALFEKIATAEGESLEMNFIKKHASELQAQGVDRPASRLFSNPPGEFGSMVSEQIGAGDWSDAAELGKTWETRNSFSYGSKGEAGKARPQVLKALLNTTDRIIQEIDCVEYGLTDIQEYYSNTGALKRAAENNRPANSSKVAISVIEAYEKNVKPREFEETLRLEYRSKLLNPKWAEAMMKQGSSGAYEISGRMTAMIGWAGTADFKEKWVFDGAAETYLLDKMMAEKLKEMNPEALRNMLKRMLEANGRGFWQPSDEVLMQLRDMYDEIEDEIEGVN